MWSWHAGDEVSPTVHSTNSRTALHAGTLPAHSQVGYNQFQGYPQTQNASNFFYGYQGSLQSGYTAAAQHIRYNPAYQTEPYFKPKSRPVSAVTEVRQTDKASKRRKPKHPNKPPILKRKDRIYSDTSQSSSPYQLTSSQSPSPRSTSPVSGDSQLGSPDFAQESVLGRASILVVDDYRSRGHHSVGSRSTKSRTSTAALREYRPSHIPDPVVPGFSFSSDEENSIVDKHSAAGSDDGRGYTRSIETTSMKSVNKNLLISSEHQADDNVDTALKPRVPTPPPLLLPPQPIYATVNKDNKSAKPKVEDPIYSTIEDAKKSQGIKQGTTSGSTKATSSDSQPLTLLSELKQRFSLRSKAKALDFSESSIPANPQSYQSAFRPYNALKASTFKMDDANEQADYDMPIPIDKAVLKDDSELSDVSDTNQDVLDVNHLEDETKAVPDIGDDKSNISNKMDSLSGYLNPDPGSADNEEFSKDATTEQVDLNRGSDDVTAEKVLDVGGVADGDVQMSLAGPLSAVTRDQASLISSVHTQSNITQSSYKSSQLPPLHEPFTAPDFQPKSILKNKNGRDDSSSSSSEESDEEDEDETKGRVSIEGDEKYHLKIPVDGPDEIIPGIEEKFYKGKETEGASSAGLTEAGKFGSIPSLHSSLRAARKAMGSQEITTGSGRRQTGVSFTSDTKDNEGLAKRYEKEGLDVPKVHKERSSTKDIFSQPLPVFESAKNVPAVPAPQPELKAAIPAKPMTEPKQVEPSVTKPKPETKDQSVATDNEALDIITPAQIQPLSVVNNTETEKRKPVHIVESTEPDKRQDYALVMKSPRGILKHPNGTATLQLNQPNQFVISTPDKCATLPNGSLKINTDLTGTHRSGGYSPTFKMGKQSPSYSVRQTGDNISVVSITGYDPAWETRSEYSMDTIRTLDDYNTGTIRTMVSLGTYSNPYMGNELAGNDSGHYRRQISETSTDPLAFSMSFDSKMFEYQRQNQQNGNVKPASPRYYKKREIPVTKTTTPTKYSKSSKNTKKTTFADHALGYDALFKKEKSKKRKRRIVKAAAILSVLVVVIVTVSLVIYFLTDKDNQQEANDE